MQAIDRRLTPGKLHGEPHDCIRRVKESAVSCQRSKEEAQPAGRRRENHRWCRCRLCRPPAAERLDWLPRSLGTVLSRVTSRLVTRIQGLIAQHAGPSSRSPQRNSGSS